MCCRGGPQHLRRAARLPPASGRGRDRCDGQGLLCLSVLRRQRHLRTSVHAEAGPCRHDRDAATRRCRGVQRDLPGPAGTRNLPGSGPAAHPPAPHAPADLGPDPGAWHLALAPAPAYPLPAATHPTGRGLTMTISTAIRWPATTPRALLRATIARVIFEHAVRRVPVR